MLLRSNKSSEGSIAYRRIGLLTDLLYLPFLYSFSVFVSIRYNLIYILQAIFFQYFLEF